MTVSKAEQRSTTGFTLTLDGAEVTAYAGETLWQVAKRAGETIPHLCFKDAPGYRSDGNCRACMVEIEGERVLAASCLREAAPGLVVKSATSERARVSREGVMELLVADQPERDASPDRSSHFWAMADQLAIDATAVRERLPARAEREAPTVHHVAERAASLPHAHGHDATHSAMNVNLDACIECNLCVRACREVQGNDVIGLAHRGAAAKIVFDFDDPMGDSTCVACGECVQACPTGALMPATLIDEQGRGDSRAADRRVDSVCPFCGVGCQLTYYVKDEPLPAEERRGQGEGEVRGPGMAEVASREGLVAPPRSPDAGSAPASARILFVEGRNGPSNENRLCVKGRFGFDYPNHPSRLTRPLIRRSGVPKGLDPAFDPATPLTHFREASWEEALDLAADGLKAIKAAQGPDGLAGFGSAKCSNEEAWLFQKLVRVGFGSNHVDHCTRLCHASSVAALMECIGSGAVT
ncbi:molybdopterin-dependent oxidoreductase, partial [Halomonas campisalis]